MKFARFEVRLHYVLTSRQRGTRIRHLSDPVREAASLVLCALESAFIYLPIDEQEFIAGSRALFAREGVAIPHEFAAPLQYFINSQLHYISHRAISGRWQVEREVLYGSASKHRADLRIAVVNDEYTEEGHEQFNIWFESDHARDHRILYKNWQKVLIGLGQQGPGHDLFVQVLYRTKDFRRLEAIAGAHWRSLDLGQRPLGNRVSFAVAYVTPSYLSKHETVESELVLFQGKSLRVNECYFHSWTRDGEFHFLNERVGGEGSGAGAPSGP